MEDKPQNLPAGMPAEPSQPLNPGPGPQRRKKGRLLLGVAVTAAVVIALGLVQHYWIAPAANLKAHASGLAAAGGHPEAPDFSLPSIDGGRVNLSDFRGKVIMIDFWATWCGPCRIEIPEFVELQNRYRNDGLAIIGISEDDAPNLSATSIKSFG